MIADIQQRAAAIDVSHSCIVQAPAGSGKTELLIQRILALLAVVEKPQQILAITFTNKAAAEMRRRLLQALEGARDKRCPEESHAAKTWTLALKALQHHGDNLLRNPAQLNIQTIDSFNVALVRKMPWVSRFGSLPEITKDADTLYRSAAEKLLSRLENGGAGQQQVKVLLRHLDNNVVLVSQLLVDMLRQRDQWLRHMLKKDENSRQSLQQGLEHLCSDYLKALEQQIPSVLIPELLFCLNFSATNLNEATASACKYYDALPGTEFGDLASWLNVADLLLTSAGDLRKTVTKKNGFPSGTENQPAKKRMVSLLQQLDPDSAFISRLAGIRKLPLAGYSDGQWLLLETLIELLPVLVAELWLVFRSHGQADFAEIALKANQALGAADDPSDLLLQIDHDLHHILVDEFQDTSRLQYQLLNTLTSGWSEGDNRTLFLVGDPMQSIYRFREAEVGLFLQSFKGVFGDVSLRLQPLQLCCNFRSQKNIVDWINAGFSTIFPAAMDAAKGAVPLFPAVAVKSALIGDSCQVFPFIGRNDAAEALQVLELVQQKQAEDPEQTIAILVRGRNHLREIIPLLRQNEISYQAQDIDLLGARPAALDVVHLTRALLHRADRLSWLAVLRAPWCGLTLEDLHTLAADNWLQTIPTLLVDEKLKQQLSADGQRRLQRVLPILQAGLKRRGSIPLRQLIESCWLALGGPASTTPAGCSDAHMVFDLLDTLDKGGDIESFERLDQDLKKIFAEPDNAINSKLQIMTIHKAKGLEFDTVIIPGLGKSTGRAENPLLRWQEHPEYGLLLAPVSEKGSQEKDPIYQLIAHLEQEKQDLEIGRLLYVATTRAIRHLYLLGHAEQDSRGELKPGRGSMLEKLWPLCRDHFLQCEPDIEIVPNEFRPPQLQRLESGWSLPVATSVLFPVPAKTKTASSEFQNGEIFSGWENPVHRHVGTLVHLQLEQISKFGFAFWSSEKKPDLMKRIEQSLAHLGVAGSDLSESTEKVFDTVNKTLKSERGQWILSQHHDHKCELSLTGVVQGQLYHVVIDRTFVADGIRWIIDYKTSTPRAGESLPAFLRREAEHYREQLGVYANLLADQSQDFPIKAALYFPALDGWYEY
ncbi:UvrD-helicase domain-containing protein [uncultured Desulfuromusa sp.]|uniref:UvrD-helicase domain-containing protein n=1 Tax=uncultured Desulfuromusa sp. TaxID=219183 RepID=UPI002AA61779|nr:UvrD-helicase domain-containing protein [uncultured Desulfuromusa sp.]